MASEATAGAPGAEGRGLNRAKQWQVALFPFNNAATNVYFAFYSYFTYFAIMYLTGSSGAALAGVVVNAALMLGVSAFTAAFVPLMRVFDGVTDPVLGGIMDRTRSRFGKFRPFMVIGNVMLALSLLIMMVFFRGLPDSVAGLRWAIYIIAYIIYVLGYTCQCACTKAGQTCLTNDPKQRSQFMIWNMIGQLGSIVLVNIMAGGILTNEAICEKGLLIYEATDGGQTISQILAGLSADPTGNAALISKLTALNLDPNMLYAYNYGAAYGPTFYNIMVPFVIILSAIYTTMAVAAITEKDKPQFWGVTTETPKLRDYVNVVKSNREIRWLVISSGFNKLASTVATSGAVAFLVFGCLMGDYNGLYIPFYVLAFIFMGLFFLWGSRTSGRKGQKRGVAQFTLLAFLFYIGVLILLCIYDPNNIATHLSLFSMEGGFHLTINAYTILFIVLYGCGYGAFNCCDQMTIPMVADCTDYETYRSGKYLPGIMGTLFSLIDKLISSLQTLLLTVFIVGIVPGLNALPTEGTPYMDGMKLSAIICFCLLPMVSWLITVFCMTRYRLSGQKLEEIQAVNAVRKAAIKGGMSLEEAMATWQTIDQVPAEFIPVKKPRINKKTGLPIEEKDNFFDKLYKKVFTRHENKVAQPSVNAIPIPEKYLIASTDETVAPAAEDSAEPSDGGTGEGT